jgi:hypothetical protein
MSIGMESDPQKGTGNPELATGEQSPEATLILGGISRMHEVNPHYPITANTVAHLVGGEEGCTRSSRLIATRVLEELATEGVLDASVEKVGADWRSVYKPAKRPIPPIHQL